MTLNPIAKALKAQTPTYDSFCVVLRGSCHDALDVPDPWPQGVAPAAPRTGLAPAPPPGQDSRILGCEGKP